MNGLKWMQLFEVLLLLMCALWDLYSHRIPNRFIIFGFVTGLMNRYMDNGVAGILIGIAIGAALMMVFMPLYLLGVFGAGDIKLLSVLSVYPEPENILKTLFLIFLTGAVFSLVKLIFYRNLFDRIKYLFQYGINFMNTGSLNEYELGDKKEQLVLPMAVPIFLGGILSIGGLL